MKSYWFITLAAAFITATTLGAAGKEQSKSAEELLAEVAALKVEKVAWRKINWQPCLLEGLKESRRQKKPIMLWIFIDRPIDDERC